MNRKLVTTLLQKRGHKVRAVENGLEAVAAVASATDEGFDVVLMDLQMPEMGGFEATQAIRAKEHAGRRLPIIALTAHAMQGDRERCLEAGMNGYLSKPIDVNHLLVTVEQFGGGGGAATESPRTAEDGATDFDEQAALSHTGGDRALLKEVVALFRADYPAALRRIEQAIRRKDGTALREAAHAVKGAIATVGGAAGRQAAADLERLGQSGSFESGQAAFATLRDRIAGLEAAFAAAGLTGRPRGKAGARKRPAARQRRSRQ